MKIAIVHPDLGIGGAERLIVDAAIELKNRGHEVTIYTSHHDPNHCFPETKSTLNFLYAHVLIIPCYRAQCNRNWGLVTSFPFRLFLFIIFSD